MKSSLLAHDNKASLAFAATIFLLATLLVLATYDPAIATENHVLLFFAENHQLLMVLLVLLAAAFGYYANNQLRGGLERRERTNEALSKTLLRLLHPHERKVVLLLKDGPRVQARLAKDAGLDRVQAHRAVKSLGEKGLLVTSSEGRSKSVSLSQDLLESLRR